MFLESIGYTAMLIEYVARQTGCSVSDIATVLGRTKIFNLCHNAPMNRLLPDSTTVDYGSPGSGAHTQIGRAHV